MEIRIKKNAYIFAGHQGKSYEFIEWLQNNEGTWIKVETEHLFTNQYNTDEFRIYDSMIDAVNNDARIGKGKCAYCGTIVNTGNVCSKHPECINYGIKWFTTKNTYFLAYPTSDKQPERELLSISENAIKIGTYYLENYPSLDYYRIYNCRKTINFKYVNDEFWINNGIGYNKTKFLDVPAKVQEKLKTSIKSTFKTS